MPAFRHKNIFEEVKNKSHDEDWVPKPASMATGSLDGTIERIKVLCDRLERGEALFHPNDEPRHGTLEQGQELQDYVREETEKRKQQELERRLAAKPIKETKHDARRIKSAKAVSQHKRAGRDAEHFGQDTAQATAS
jgi:hypothetical protein